MHVLVTGAAGFVGRGLVERLLGPGLPLGRPIDRLTALDRRIEGLPADERLRAIEGELADAAVLQQALAPAPDVVFHLASVPGALAQREPALGTAANLLAPIALFERLAAESDGAAPPNVGTVAAPRVVFASSVAVYGALPDVSGEIDESFAPRPTSSYGTHKLMAELLLADHARRGTLDAVSLRLPGIVARPAGAGGHGSAFMSDVIRTLVAGAPYVCPVSAGAQAWWMSLPCCIDNLLHAATLPAEKLPATRSVQLPVITATIAAVVAAIEALRGAPADITHAPQDAIETRFGRQPVLHAPRAHALGFTDDGTLARLVARATGETDNPP